jgi:hypothetical protein
MSACEGEFVNKQLERERLKVREIEKQKTERQKDRKTGRNKERQE